MNIILIRIFNRFHSFITYNLFLYANYILLFAFIFDFPVLFLKNIVLHILPSYLIVGVGGYFLNDLFDQKEDRMVNKFNITTIINKYFLLLLIGIIWTIGFLFIYNISQRASLLLIIQYFALILYSAPISRLKVKGIWGLITDALYAHFIPELILLVIIQEYTKIPLLLSVSFLLFNFSFGMRDIIIHQLNDLNKDRLSNTRTFVLNNLNASKYLIKYFQFTSALSLILFLCFVCYFKFSTWSFLLFISLLLSYVIAFIEYGNLKDDRLIKNYIIISSILFSYLIINSGYYFYLLLLIHPYFISFVFKTDIPLIFNYVLYYLFLLFGRNLKEKPLYKKNK